MTEPIPHLTPEEVQVIRAALAERRAAGGFEPGRWSVSPLNRRPEVLSADRAESMPTSVSIRDITLRVVEQAPGVRLTAADRRIIGDRLLDAGIRRLEVSAHGWGVDPGELAASISSWRARQPDLEVKMGATQTVDMVAEAARLGVSLVTHWVPAIPELTPVYWPEAYRRAWAGGRWHDADVPTNMSESLNVVARVRDAARGEGLELAVGINILSFATADWLEEFLGELAADPPHEVWLSDGSSGLSPEAWEFTVALVRKILPASHVGIYTKNAYGLGVAALIAAARAGADILETAINGFSMASGQPDLAQVVMALEALYGVHTGIDLAALTPLSRLLSSLTGHDVEPTRPIVGSDVHNWGGAEFITQERKLDPLIHWSYEPSLTGGRASWDVTPITGMWGIFDLARRLGLDLTREQLTQLRALILESSAARRRALSDEEIRALAATMGGRLEPGRT